jgi:uncharacterized membrane protein YgcG
MTASDASGAPARRRRLAVWVLAAIAVVAAVATYIASRNSSEERIPQLWVMATVADDGSARVVEVIDYDFGSNSRHGIFRDVPDLSPDEPVEVSSPDAPDDVDVTSIPGFIPHITIGDPDRTVSGLHRYVLEYTLDGLAPGGDLAWNAVGTDWDVPIDHAEVHVLSDRIPNAPTCVHGFFFENDPCRVDRPEPGHLVTDVDRLLPGQGVTVAATLGGALDGAPSVPAQPEVAAGQPGSSPFLTALLVLAVAALVGLAGARLLRRAGREPLPPLGIPGLVGQERVDLDQLAAHASPSADLPAGLTPSQGGVLLADDVLDQHKAAWLLERAAAGLIDLESGTSGARRDVVLVRLEKGTEGRHVLDLAFRGRDRVPLGKYDRDFAAAWQAIGDDLRRWRARSELWDQAASRRTTRVRTAGTVVGIAGIVVAAVGGSLSASTDTTGLLVAVAGAVLTGAGFAAALSGWELRRLTPEGSAAWLRVEGLRRYFRQATTDAEPVDPGQVGLYTAWAVALGEAHAWSRLTSRAATAAREAGDGFYDHHYYRWTTFAPSLAASCSTTSVSPSSGSSGSSGGGGISGGGGGGGGGGGSW